MGMRARQDGMTLIGFAVVLMIFGTFAFVFMRLFPAYSEFNSVKTNMGEVTKEPGIASASNEKIKDSLARKFFISYVTSVKPEHIFIDRKGGVRLTIKYEVRSPMAYNLDFVAKFEHTVSLTGG